MLNCQQVELTEEQYLAIERAAEFKSEFLDGVMYAMSGGSPRHSSLAINILAELRAALRGSECKPFNSDLRVRVPPRMYAYPDVSVVCESCNSPTSRRTFFSTRS
jgi:Uma2 family endonuclease